MRIWPLTAVLCQCGGTYKLDDGGQAIGYLAKQSPMLDGWQQVRGAMAATAIQVLNWKVHVMYVSRDCVIPHSGRTV